LIDASSGATIATLRAGPPGRTHAAFARGGSLVLTTNVHRGSRLWDAASGHLLRQLPDRGRRVWNGAISPTGDLIAAAVSNRVYLWTRGGKPRGVVRVRNQVEDVAFSPDGELLAIGDVWGIVRIRRLGPGTTSPKLGEGLGRVTSLGFGPDGRAVLAAGEGKVQALAIAGGEAQTLVEGSSSSTLYPPEPNAVDASADGLLAVGYGDGTLTATDFRPLDRGFTTQSGGGAVTDLDFSPDGHSIVTAQADGSVRLFAVSSMQRSVTSLGPPGGIQSIALSPDGRFLAATFPPEVMELVDLPARLLGTSVWRLSDRRPWKVSANPGDLRADFSPDGRLLAIAGVRRTAVWPLFARRPAWRLPTSSVDVAFSPDSTLLAIAGRRGAVTVRRAGDGRLVETVPKEGRSWARRVSFSPDGSALLAVGSDGVVRLWDRDERTVMRSFGGRGDAFVEAVLSADGERVAAISAARLAVIDLDSGETARTAPIGSQDLRSVAFSSDSRSVVVAGEDGRATVLSVDGLHPVTDFVLSGESLSAAAFGPDPTLVALGGDGGVKVFRCDLCLPPSRLLTLAEATAIRGLSPAERRRYLG
jgi:WD40 repeat protein